MTLKAQYLDVIKHVAEGLGELNDRVVYVGGAVVGLYANDTAADDVRATLDVDITIEVSTLAELEELRELLNRKGFLQSHNDTVVCRFRYDGILVDVMSTQEIGWAPGSDWFQQGFETAIPVELGDKTIRILQLPYFLAAKIEAYSDRGTDPRTSKDFEDIVYLLDSVTDLPVQIADGGIEAKTFIKQFFRAILADTKGEQEGIYAHLNPHSQTQRFQIVMEKVKQVIALE